MTEPSLQFASKMKGTHNQSLHCVNQTVTRLLRENVYYYKHKMLSGYIEIVNLIRFCRNLYYIQNEW